MQRGRCWAVPCVAIAAIRSGRLAVEQTLALDHHGLADIEHIVQQAPQHLNVGGLLALEHGFDQGLAVRQLFLDNRFESVHTVQDFGGNDRVTLGQLL